MTSFKTVLRNSGYQLGSRFLSRLLLLGFTIYATLKLSTEVFGVLSFALATVELLSAMGDLGLTRLGARELVKQWDRRSVLAGEILVLQIGTSLVFALFGVALVLAWHPDSPKFELLMLGMLAIFLSGIVNTAETAFVAGQRFFNSAVLTFMGRVIYFGIGFVALAANVSVVLVMWGFVIAVSIESLIRIIVVVKTVTPFSFRFPSQEMWAMLRTTVPFAVAAAANIAFLRVNVMILELLSGDTAVGVFNLAYTLFTPIIWIPLILSRTIFPGLTEDWIHAPDRARMTTWQWYRLMALAGIPAAMAVTLLAGPVLSHFPSDYHESSTVLAILIWALPFFLVISIGFNVQQIINRERAAARVQLVGAVVNAAACFVLIPLYGIVGAAVATLIGVAIMQAQIYHNLHKYFFAGKHTYVLFVRPAIAGAVMAAVALLLDSVNPWLATAAGLFVYAGVILATGAVRPAELSSLLGRHGKASPAAAMAGSVEAGPAAAMGGHGEINTGANPPQVDEPTGSAH